MSAASELLLEALRDPGTLAEVRRLLGLDRPAAPAQRRLVPTSEVARLVGYKTPEGFLTMAQADAELMALARRGPWKGFRWDPDAVLAHLDARSRGRIRDRRTGTLQPTPEVRAMPPAQRPAAGADQERHRGRRRLSQGLRLE